MIGASLGLSLKLLWVLRLYPKTSDSTFYTLQAIAAYITFIILIPILNLIYTLTRETDIATINRNFMCFAQCTAFAFKIYPFIAHSSSLKACVTFFNGRYFDMKDLIEEEIMENCIKVCQRNAKIFAFITSGSVVTWHISPVFAKEYKLPVDVWLPNVDYSKEFSGVYCVLYAVTAVAGTYIAFAGSTIDPLLGGLAFHISRQLKILNHRLIRLSATEINSHLGHYESIALMVDKYQSCFSLVILSQFTAGIFFICFWFLRLSKLDPLSFDGLSNILYVQIILLQLYFYCYFGQLIHDESEALLNAIYVGRWYEYDKRAIKSLAILMERAKRPLLIKCLNLVQVSLETFTLILRRSYSLLALLKNYQ